MAIIFIKLSNNSKNATCYSGWWAGESCFFSNWWASQSSRPSSSFPSRGLVGGKRSGDPSVLFYFS